MYETFLGLLSRAWKQVQVVAASLASPATRSLHWVNVTHLNYTGKRKGKSSLQDKAKRKITLGGYELLRISDENRSVPQPIPQGYTVPYLKEVLKQAKVYIRPLQRSLTLDQVPSSSITLQV